MLDLLEIARFFDAREVLALAGALNPVRLAAFENAPSDAKRRSP